MTSSFRGRLAAAAVAAATVGGLLAAVQPAQAAPAYQNSFIAFGSGNAPNWTVVNPDGSNQHDITPSGGGFDAATMTVAGLKYSPDGSQAAFTAATPNEARPNAIWLAKADGSGAHKLLDLPTDSTVYRPNPAWSPDGKVLYYGLHGQIMQVRTDGTGAPTAAFTDAGDCNDAAPQTTHSGAIYFSRDRAHGGDSRTGQYSGYAIHRPGDPLPIPSGSDTSISAISPDGTRYAENWSMDQDTLIVNPINVDDIMHKTAQLPKGHLLSTMAFGPSGDLVYVDASYTSAGSAGSTWTATINTVADQVNQTPHKVTTVVSAKPNMTAVNFVDWVDGAANFGTRPVADRVGGGDRIATSIAASKWTYDDKTGTGRKASAAVLARSDNFADALGGTALAIQSNGPLLLTPTSGLNKDVENELTRILPAHSFVYVLGGTAALSPAVEKRLTALGYSVQRLSGDDRYATSVAIAQTIGSGPNWTDSVMIATGDNYPDALAAGVAAGQERFLSGSTSHGIRGGVVVLTNGTNMPKATADYLKHVDPHVQHVYTVGGQAVTAVAKAFPSWTGVTPLAGATRYETAAKVAASPLFGSGAAGRYSMVGVATAANWPDALSGGALIGNQGGPLLLADASGTPGSQSAVVSGAKLKGLVVFGGTAVVPDSALNAIANNAFGAGAWDAGLNRSAPALP